MPVAVTQYIFGNSLINHVSPSNLTNVPVWLDQFAEEDGNSYSANGEYGFLREFADRPEPLSQWGFEGVDSNWDSESEDFDEASFSTILIAPANFIQDLSPDSNYFGDSRSPFDAVADLVSDVTTAQPDARIFIYEGWADMGPFAETIPPSTSAEAAYHAYNMGDYHDWYASLVDMVNTADPDADVTLIPVASILSELLSTTLSDVSAEEFYTDNAPHGTETLYYLASMITYQADFGSIPPEPATPPSEVHPAVFSNFDTITALIDTRLTEAGLTDPLDDTPLSDNPEGEDAEDAETEGGSDPVEPDFLPIPAAAPVVGHAASTLPPFEGRYFSIHDPQTELADVDFATSPDAYAFAEGLDFDADAPPWAQSQTDQHAAYWGRVFDVDAQSDYLLEIDTNVEALVFVNGEMHFDSRDASAPETHNEIITLDPGENEVEVMYITRDPDDRIYVDLLEPPARVEDPIDIMGLRALFGLEPEDDTHACDDTDCDDDNEPALLL